MKTFKQWCEAIEKSRGIVIHHQGPTPQQVDPQGGWSIWYWNDNDDQTPNTLKVSFPIKDAEPIPSGDAFGGLSGVKITDNRGVVYTATGKPVLVATLVKQVKQMNPEPTGPNYARINNKFSLNRTAK